MCGLVGVINPVTLQHDKWFSQALIVDQLRGHHSTGAFVSDAGGSVTWHKQAVTGSEFVLTPEYVSMMRPANLRGYVGHNRWATMGSVNDTNAHPFNHGDITLVHNGTLSEHHKDAVPMAFGTDSEGIAYALSQEGANTESILGELSGAFALVWHDLHDNCIRIVRNSERELWWAKCSVHDTILFASEPKMLEWLADRNKISLTGVPQLFAKDTLYRFDLSKAIGADRIKPYVKQVTLRKYQPPAYSDSYWYPKSASRWDSRSTQHSSTVKSLPAKSEIAMLARDRAAFLNSLGIDIGSEVVCSVLDVTLMGSNAFKVDAMYDLTTTTGKLADAVVYNVPAPLSMQQALKSRCVYMIGKVINVRLVDGEPTLVLNPSTVWLGDECWEELFVAVNGGPQLPVVHEAVTPEPTVQGTLRGPQGVYIPAEEWDKLCASGCFSCRNPIRQVDHELVEWESTRPICHHCVDEDPFISINATHH